MSRIPSHPAGSVRRRFITAAVAVVGAVALYTAYWYAAAHQLRSGLEAWTAEQHRRGLRIDLGQPEIEGYPGWLRVRVARPGASTVETADSWRWQGPPIDARSRPWRPWSIAFDGDGRHRITVSAGGAARTVIIDATGLSGRVVVGGNDVRSLRLDLRALTVTTKQPADPLTLAAAVLKLNRPAASGEAAEPAPVLGFDLDLQGLKLPKRAATPLGDEIAALTLRGHLSGPVVGAGWPEVLVSWRDGGGVIEVADVTVRHGPLNVSGGGTIALDAAMQPVTAFTVRAEGYSETVDALRKAGQIKTGDATATKLVLAVLAKRPNGGPPYIEAPLTVQDRRLRIGPLDLLEIPVVSWSRTSPRP